MVRISVFFHFIHHHWHAHARYISLPDGVRVGSLRRSTQYFIIVVLSTSHGCPSRLNCSEQSMKFIHRENQPSHASIYPLLDIQLCSAAKSCSERNPLVNVHQAHAGARPCQSRSPPAPALCTDRAGSLLQDTMADQLETVEPFLQKIQVHCVPAWCLLHLICACS